MIVVTVGTGLRTLLAPSVTSCCSSRRSTRAGPSRRPSFPARDRLPKSPAPTATKPPPPCGPARIGCVSFLL
eukprot:2624594-Prorocentrum_lima.AAC.1